METSSYIFYEKIGTSFSDESPFFINEHNSEISMLFRILSGTCIITNKNSDDSAVLGRNFFYGGNNNENNDLSFLNDFEEGLNLSDYENHISAHGFKNRKFYKSLLNEISAAIYNEEKEHHTAAFVHIYRAYEHLSYAFPMIYAAKTENYIGTFENLRKWMTCTSSDGNVGELKFHKSFVATLFKDTPEISSTIDVHIMAKEEFKESIFDGLAVKILGWDNDENYTPSTLRPDKLSVQFVEFHSFLVNLRNRYFHYSNQRSDNISLEDIIESDLLFSIINKPAISYITSIFHGVTKHQI